jgi:hypothetical protein
MATAVAIANAHGISVVASTGNSGSSHGVTAPACLENVISVASVWDQDPTETGSAFCLDPACAVTCNDRNKRIMEPTCYSNTGRPLDLFAPSEYLTVAEASGQFVAFGGTSGAAPYVTGSLALLKRAFPRLEPEHLRTILAASGQPLTDPRNGLSRPVIDLVDALEIDDLAFGEDVGATVPVNGVPSMRSHAPVAGHGAVGAVKVYMRLSCEDVSSYEISLGAPDGTTVALLAEGGSSPTHGGIFGAFPRDLEPAQSLDLLIGTERHGVWTLEISTGKRDAPTATLESWALQIEDLLPPTTPPTTGTVVIPIAARGPGAAGTRWRTGMRAFNPARFNLASGSLYYVPEGVDGGSHFIQRPLEVPAGVTLDLHDVIADTFGLEIGAGQVLVETAGSPLVVTGRIETQTGDLGSFGQFVASSRPSSGDAVVLLPLLGPPGYRTNVGISETFGVRAVASMTLFDAATGSLLGPPIELEVAPFSTTRIDRLFEETGVPDDTEVYATVESDGQVIAWASVVDAGTGDAVFVPGRTPVRTVYSVVPIVARAPGREGTTWRSDVRVAVQDDRSVDLTLEMRTGGETPAPVYTATTTVAPRTVAIMKDIVAERFGRERDTGSLRILSSPSDARLVIASRTYNVTEAGTYGQQIPAVSAGLAVSSSIIHVDGSADMRTNLFVCELGGQSLQLVYSLRDGGGLAIGQPQLVTLGPFEVAEVLDVFAAAGTEPQVNCRIDLQPIAGDGTYTALASVVDNHTGDAIAIPAVPSAAD